MNRIAVFVLLAFAFASCNSVDSYIGRDKKKDITYSYSCLDSSMSGKKMNERLGKAGDLIRDIAVSEKSITDEMQTEYGRQFHEEMVKEGEFKLVNDKALSDKLNNVLKRLLDAREDGSSIGYHIYALDDTVINAFTFGGQIYVTQGMLKECQGNDALLYAVVGHEIGHSEMGHIKGTIQELILSDKVFGENGATFYQIKQLLTASFNQKNELQADYYGINLTSSLGYDVCTAVAFWKKMASNENSYSQVEDFFRTHPFSKLRAECLVNHLRTNFNRECGSVNEATSHPEVVSNKSK